MVYQAVTREPREEISKDSILALKGLPRLLAREGYVDALALYGPLNAQETRWAGDLPLLPANLQVLFRLFLLGQAVPVEEVQRILTAKEIAALEDLSILFHSPYGLHTRNLALISAYGYLLLAQRPSVNPMVYFGEDSAALAAHLAPSTGDLCLDLCAGPGIQSLLCSGHASRVIAVEINPLTASFAELNVIMNSLEDKIEVRNGDLYEAVGDLKFDFICANPPLLPFPPELPYPFVGHGGSDGLGITRRVLNGLDSHLKDGGFCQIIGTCLGDEKGPLCEDELADFSKRGYQITMSVPTVASLQPDSQVFRSLAWTCAAGASLSLDEVTKRFEVHLENLKATRLHLYFLAISKDETRAGFAVTRHYRECRGFWFI